MSFACDTCDKILPAKKGRAWATCCPWCGGPVTFIGLTAAPAAVLDGQEQTPITLTPSNDRPRGRLTGAGNLARLPAPRPVGAGHPKGRAPVREWVMGAGIIAVLVLVLLGMSWFLVSRSTAKPNGPEIATLTEPDQNRSGMDLARPGDGLGPLSVGRLTEPQKADSVHLPLGKEPVEKKQPEAPKPIQNQEKPEEPPQPLRQPDLAAADIPEMLPLPTTEFQVAALQPQQPAPPQQPAQPQQPASLSATFMGVKSMGKRICIIADCSGSMAFNNRMVRLKKEMGRTLKALSPEQEFYVIYFSSNAIPMPAKSWRHGGKDVKKILP